MEEKLYRGHYKYYPNNMASPGDAVYPVTTTGSVEVAEMDYSKMLNWLSDHYKQGMKQLTMNPQLEFPSERLIIVEKDLLKHARYSVEEELPLEETQPYLTAIVQYFTIATIPKQLQQFVGITPETVESAIQTVEQFIKFNYSKSSIKSISAELLLRNYLRWLKKREQRSLTGVELTAYLLQQQSNDSSYARIMHHIYQAVVPKPVTLSLDQLDDLARTWSSSSSVSWYNFL